MCRTEKDLMLEEEGAGESILGFIHLNLAIYHETCRYGAFLPPVTLSFVSKLPQDIVHQ
jgi:hypothetical protein